MKIRQILSKECVLASLNSKTKEEVLVELSALLAEHHKNVATDQVVQVLTEREKLGSTGIGNGVAIPHGKLTNIEQILTAFGRSLDGIAFDSQDGKPAHLFFVLLAPENAASLHLKALARLSRLLKDVNFRNKLIEAKTQDEIYQEIVSEDEKF